MELTKKELGFILYNNRSTDVVKNFLPIDINPIRLINIENKFEKSKLKYRNINKNVEVNLKEINLEAGDIIVDRDLLLSTNNTFVDNIGKFSDRELSFMKNRKIPDSVIKKWKLLGLSNFSSEELDIIGATVHPTMSRVLSSEIDGGGIVFPLYDNGELKNCAIRRISIENNEKSSLKYSLACPDVSIWKSKDIQPGDEIWLTEGLFDMFALDELGYKSVSCSSAMWSGIQLYELVLLRPSVINIFSDNDEVGLRVSAILFDFFTNYGVNSNIYKSNNYKDASEHFFENEQKIESLEVIKDIEKLLLNTNDESFDFINYIKNRKF